MDQVAYRPLDTRPPDIHDEDVSDDGDEPHGRIEPGSRLFSRRPSGRMSSNGSRGPLVTLRQLRKTLYLVAAILFLIFLAQLTTYQNSPRRYSSAIRSVQQTTQEEKPIDSNGSSREVPLEIDTNHIKGATNNGNQVSHDKTSDQRTTTTIKPPEQIPDDLQLPLSDQTDYLNDSLLGPWWQVGSRVNNTYTTVTNYIRAMKSFNFNSSITLTTQATTEYVYHILELCKRWDGPISVAVFCPGQEMAVAVTLVKFMRQCLPALLSACIRDKVTWHLAYNRAHGPSVSYPQRHLDRINFPLFAEQDQCPKLAGPNSEDSIRQFEEQLRRVNGIYPKSYRQQFQLPYPINVVRNTARLAAETRYILASDVELYPSVNLVPYFMNLVTNHNISSEFAQSKRYIFTLPIFEVRSNVSAPRTKDELVRLFKQNDAIFFHKLVCDECQNFPNRLKWLQTDQVRLDNYHPTNEELTIFDVTQRNKSRDSWEPIFIGTNADPLYDDRLTWDGRRDKMAQMFEMCLEDYNLLILGNAFLVHAPGIKRFDREDYKKRLKSIKENNLIYDASLLELKRKNSNTRNINKC